MLHGKFVSISTRYESQSVLVVGEHSNVVNTLGLKLFDLLNKSWDVAGAAHRCVCSWDSNNDGLQRVSPA